MKGIITLLLVALVYSASNSQCSTASVQVSSSDTSSIQLYHAGFFNIPSGFANICDWEVTSFAGQLIHMETTSGEANDQGFVIFDHSVPITDSMKVTILITNNMEGITCTMNDTLYWEETEILPGSFIGNWSVLSGSGGVEDDIPTSVEMIPNSSEISLYPSPVLDHFKIKGDLEVNSYTIFNSNGQILASEKNINPEEEINISHFSAGVYFVQFWDDKSRNLGIKKIVKM